MSNLRPFLRAPHLLASLCTTPCPRTFSTAPRLALARITLVGRLAAEPELTPTASGAEVIRYGLATNFGPKESRQTTWWRVACFAGEGKMRDLLLSLGKGSMVYVEGEARMQQYTDKEGHQQSALNIVQRNFEVLDRRDGKVEEQEGETE